MVSLFISKKNAFFVKKFCTLVFSLYICSPNEGTRGVAQLASASGLGPEGPVFESQYPDIMIRQPFVNQAVAFIFILTQINYLCSKEI